MRNNDWGLRACIVGVTMVLGLAPLFAEVSGTRKLPCHQLRNRMRIILRRRMISADSVTR